MTIHVLLSFFLPPLCPPSSTSVDELLALSLLLCCAVLFYSVLVVVVVVCVVGFVAERCRWCCLRNTCACQLECTCLLQKPGADVVAAMPLQPNRDVCLHRRCSTQRFGHSLHREGYEGGILKAYVGV